MGTLLLWIALLAVWLMAMFEEWKEQTASQDIKHKSKQSPPTSTLKDTPPEITPTKQQNN